MTKKDLIKALEPYSEDDCVVCMDDNGCWDNIQDVVLSGSSINIVFGGGSPFTSDH